MVYSCFVVVHAGLWWFYGSSWWFVVVYGGLWLFTVVCCGSWCFYGGFTVVFLWWLVVVCLVHGSLRWFVLVLWRFVVVRGSSWLKWFLVVHDGL